MDMFNNLPKWGRVSIVSGAGILGIMMLSGQSESFAADPVMGGGRGPPSDDDDFEGFHENRCHICERPYEFSKIARGLVQHYLKESDDASKDWRTKKNPDGTVRTARNIAGAELYWYGLEALEHYMAEGKESKMKPLVIELLRKSTVPNVMVGDTVQFIESLEIEGVDDLEPRFSKEFTEEMTAESFEAEDKKKRTTNLRAIRRRRKLKALGFKRGAESFEAEGIREGRHGSILNFEFDEGNISWEDDVLPLIEEYTTDWNAYGVGFGDVSVVVQSPRKVVLKKLKVDLDNELGGFIHYGTQTLFFEAPKKKMTLKQKKQRYVSNKIGTIMRDWKKTGRIGTSRPKSKKAAQRQAIAVAYSYAKKRGHRAEEFEAMEEINKVLCCSDCGINVEEEGQYGTLTINCSNCDGVLYEDNSYDRFHMIDFAGEDFFEAEDWDFIRKNEKPNTLEDDEEPNLQYINNLTVWCKENPLYDMFQEELLWVDDVDVWRNYYRISFLSNHDPEITPKQAKALKEYIEKYVMKNKPPHYELSIYLPSGPLEAYLAEYFRAEDFDAEVIRTFQITSVEYDTYDEESDTTHDPEELGLPQKMNFTIVVEDDDEIEGVLVDKISDTTGWLVHGFTYDEINPSNVNGAEDFEAEQVCIGCGAVTENVVFYDPKLEGTSGTAGPMCIRCHSNTTRQFGAEDFFFDADYLELNQEHGDHDGHDAVDDMIEDLDKLTAFCISFLHDGAYGGETQGVEDVGGGLTEERVLYVEGSIELKFVYDSEGQNIAIRARYTNDPDSPVIYLPKAAFIATKPGEIEEHH